MTKKLKGLDKPKELQKLKPLDELTSEITTFKTDCNTLGMEEKSIDAMMNRKKVINCPYCKTFNMCEIFYHEEAKWTMYECYKCGKSYLVLQDDEKK
jgi:transposase-like protein